MTDAATAAPGPGRLAGKVAVVTGAGQTPGETMGNGRAISLLFAREGAAVCCVDRVLERAADTAAEIEAAGGRSIAVAADVTVADDDARALDTAADALGPVDIVVNNVGIRGAGDGPAHRLTDEALDLILEVNLKGAWRVIRAALPAMRERRSGSIVNISSLASTAGGGQLAYEVSKAGLNRVTTSVAASQAKYRIRCNAVLPGLLDTPMAVDGIAAATGRPRGEVKAQRDARVPLGGAMGTAMDTAYAALYLASDESRFVTGALLPVDGGLGL